MSWFVCKCMFFLVYLSFIFTFFFQYLKRILPDWKSFIYCGALVESAFIQSFIDAEIVGELGVILDFSKITMLPVVTLESLNKMRHESLSSKKMRQRVQCELLLLG